MKKIVLSSLLVSSFVLAAAAPVAVLADSVGTTPGEITFTEDEDTTGPKKPEDPSQPGDEDDDDNKPTNNPGPLSLDVVPAIFDFGTDKVAVDEKTYTAKTTDFSQYLQVTDKRTDANGWTVKASRTEFISGANQLTGSTLNIPAGTAKNEKTAAATPTGLTTAAANLKAGQEVTVFSAANQAEVGKLSSTSYWAGNQVTLTVPGMTAKAGKYTSTITWTLAALPGS